jgi:hypothetical protein
MSGIATDVPPETQGISILNLAQLVVCKEQLNEFILRSIMPRQLRLVPIPLISILGKLKNFSKTQSIRP